LDATPRFCIRGWNVDASREEAVVTGFPNQVSALNSCVSEAEGWVRHTQDYYGRKNPLDYLSNCEQRKRSLRWQTFISWLLSIES